MRYMQRRTAALMMATGGAAVALAACGSSGGGATAGGGSTGVAAQAGGAANLGMHSTSLGRVLTSGGRTIYLLTADQPGHQACTTGACQRLWPPVKVSSVPKGASGISAKLGVAHGQLTVNGHPAYLFAGDSSAGQVNGEGMTDFGGHWWAISPKGTGIVSGGSNAGASTSGSSGNSGGGYGYGY